MIQNIVDDEEKLAKWNNYINMVDDEVLQGLTRAIDFRFDWTITYWKHI